MTILEKADKGGPMKSLLRFWRWLTLADIPVQYPQEPAEESTGGCDFCDDAAVCSVTVNTHNWRTCVAHMNKPLELFLASERSPELMVKRPYGNEGEGR